MAQNVSDAQTADCVRAWTAAVAGLPQQPVRSAELEHTLTGLVRRLVNVLHDQPFAVEPASKVGAALVAAGLTDPEVLGRTIDVLDPHLAALAGREDAQVRIRLVRLLGAVSTGFARALQQHAAAAQRPRVAAAQRPAVAAAQRPRVALTDAPAGVAIVDPHGRLVDVNRTLADLLDYSVTDLVGNRLTDLVHREDVAEVADQLNRLVGTGASGAVRVERRLVRRDGAARWMLMALSVVRDENGGDSVAIVAQDVTDHHRLELKLRHQAQHDPLTGLPNRALFIERLDRLFHPPTAVPGAAVGLCFLDLDGFKAINDGLGHQIGDQLLTAVAERINRCVIAEGHLLARIGGDEFVMLLADHVGPGSTTALAEKVLRSLDQPFRIGDHELRVSASIGVVERPVAATTPAELLWDADVAGRRAKASGKGRWARLDLDRSPHDRLNSSKVGVSWRG